MKFRLKMDLSQFYHDERNLAYILVDPKWDQVICLQEHVQRLFDVPEVQFLTDDGIYIPPRESIDVIKSNDVLRAIIPLKSKKKKKKEKSKSSSQNGSGIEPSDDSLEIIGEKRKCDNEEETGLTCSTPNVQPKKKQRTSNKKEENNSLIIVMDQSSIKEPQDEESNIQALQNSNTVTSTIDSHDPDKSKEAKNEVFAHPADVSDATIKSRKRKRVRKNKKSLEEKEKDEKNSRLSSVPIPISSSTLRLSKTMSTPNSSVKHVHFSDDEPTLVEENPKSKENLVTYRSLLSMDAEARIIEAEEEVEEEALESKNVDESRHEKPVIQIHEHIVLVPAPGLNVSLAGVDQDDTTIVSVIEVDDSVVRSETDEDSQVVNESYQDINVDKILPLSEELLDMPNVGDVILFKMYQLSEACTPEISKYICGRCEEIDPTKKTLNCLVLDGLEQLDENLPRLTPSDENQVKRWGNMNCFEFSLNEMLDKRVFKM